MAIEEEPEPGIPEWVVTFGDMMSLLLTFFIMLVSMSEMKEEERFQAMLESMRRQFGHEQTMASVLPGQSPPRTSMMSTIASLGRAKRQNLANGGNKVKAPTGESARVRTIRPGRTSTVGGVLFFEEDSAELSAENLVRVKQIAQQIAGKPQKVEVRGHTSRKPTDGETHWSLGHKRAQATMTALVDAGIDAERIRLSSAGSHEPLDNGADIESRKRNARVEVLMWDEASIGTDA
ncbi:MAG: OmpA family protein [Planctomycetota bacterium]